MLLTPCQQIGKQFSSHESRGSEVAGPFDQGFLFLFFALLALLTGKNNHRHSGYKKPIIDSGTSTLVARASLYLHDAPRDFDLEIA